MLSNLINLETEKKIDIYIYLHQPYKKSINQNQIIVLRINSKS